MTATAPEFRTAKRSPGLPRRKEFARRRAVENRIADDEVLVRDVGVGGAPERPHRDLASAQSLADVIVRLALELQVHPAAGECSEALTRGAGEPQPDRAGRQSLVAVALGDRPGHPRADREVVIVDRIAPRERQPTLQVRLEVGEDFAVERHHSRPIVARFGPPQDAGGTAWTTFFVGRRHQHRQVEHLRARDVRPLDPFEQIVPPDDLVQGSRPDRRENPAHLFRQKCEVADHLIGRALELRPQVLALRGDAGGTGVDVALAGHRASHRHQWRGTEAVTLRTQERRDHHIATGLESTVGPHFDPVSQSVSNQDRLGLRQPQLPRRAGVLDRAEG